MKRILLSRGLAAVTGILLSFLVSAQVVAQTFPSKPIRVLIGFPAGSSLDIVGFICIT